MTHVSLTTPTSRRTLHFHSLDEVMPEVERLLKGCKTVGRWSLAQICHHLAVVLRRVVDLPASTPHDTTLWISPEKKREIFESGRIPEGLPAPPEVEPTGVGDERTEAEGLRAALAHFLASSGPVIPHRFLGPLTRAEWEQLQAIHCAHHLSFAIPCNSQPD